MKLNQIKDNIGATHNRKTVGRGIGSGLGKTAGKGHKGQKARGTGKVRLGFEGGQNPIYRRLPKRGFNNPFKVNYFVINLGLIQKYIDATKIDPNTEVNLPYLREVGIVKGTYDGLKILAKGDIKNKLNILADGCSQKAQQDIEAVGGSVSIIKKEKFSSKKAKK